MLPVHRVTLTSRTFQVLTFLSHGRHGHPDRLIAHLPRHLLVPCLLLHLPMLVLLNIQQIMIQTMIVLVAPRVQYPGTMMTDVVGRTGIQTGMDPDMLLMSLLIDRMTTGRGEFCSSSASLHNCCRSSACGITLQTDPPFCLVRIGSVHIL